MNDIPRDPAPAHARLGWLAEAAVDAREVDWDQEATSAPSGAEGAVIRQLGVLAGIGRMFRVSDEEEAWDQSTTTTGPAASVTTCGEGSMSWGPFAIRATLGEGTFGTVYRAWESELDRHVALKILHKVDARAAGRLVEEARLLARIRHPNIVTIYGADRFEGQVGFWMELVDGRTLRQLQKEQGTCSAQEAVLFGLDLCRALAAVHHAGFLHCDVKAQNVMREAGGRTVLMDFGAAALQQAGNRVGGTPLYMAPERLEGSAPTVRSDLYSVGVLLYYLVSGTFPVEGRTIDELRTAHARRRQRLRDVRSDLPASFVRVIDAVTAVRPDDRPDSAGALEALLERAADRFASRTRPTRGEAASGTRRERSIAVLPFVDLSPDRRLDYFCEGIAEEIINALMQVPGVRVIGRTSSFKFRARHDDPGEVGSALDVETILEGSVRTSGNRLRVTARLIDAADGSSRWSERFDRQLEDVFAVQDDIAQAAARALGAAAPGGEAVGVPAGRPLRWTHDDAAPIATGTTGTRDLEAYTLCLRGRFAWNQRTETALAHSIDWFEAAVARDPLYADAYAGLAEAHATLGFYGGVAPDIAMPRAKAAARRAIELSGSQPGPHATLGCVSAIYERQWREAAACFDRAIRLAPMHPTVRHWHAINYLVPLQRFDEAGEELRRACGADPISTPIHASVGILHYFARRFHDAERHLRETLALDAASSTVRLFLGLTLAETRRHDEAMRELELARALSPSPEMTAAIGYVAARAGDAPAARRALADLESLARARYVSPSLIAQIHAGLGDTVAALDSLERASEVRALDLAWLAVRPVFDDLRSAPRLRALLVELGL